MSITVSGLVAHLFDLFVRQVEPKPVPCNRHM